MVFWNIRIGGSLPHDKKYPRCRLCKKDITKLDNIRPYTRWGDNSFICEDCRKKDIEELKKLN